MSLFMKQKEIIYSPLISLENIWGLGSITVI